MGTITSPSHNPGERKMGTFPLLSSPEGATLPGHAVNLWGVGPRTKTLSRAHTPRKQASKKDGSSLVYCQLSLRVGKLSLGR